MVTEKWLLARSNTLQAVSLVPQDVHTDDDKELIYTPGRVSHTIFPYAIPKNRLLNI